MQWFGHFFKYFELFWYKLMPFWNWTWYISMQYRYYLDDNSMVIIYLLNSILFDGLSMPIRYLYNLSNLLFDYFSILVRYDLNLKIDDLVLNLMSFNSISILVLYFLNLKDIWLMHVNFDAYSIVYQFIFDTF